MTSAPPGPADRWLTGGFGPAGLPPDPTDGGDRTGPRPLDLRLVPAALLAWAVVAVSPVLGPALLMSGSAAAAVAAGTALLTRRRWAAGVAAALGCAALAAFLMSLRVAERDDSPLRVMAAASAEAGLVLVVTDDPRSLGSSRPGREQVIVAATATSVTWRGETRTVDAEVVVLADAADWVGILPGQRLSLRGQLRPALAGQLTVAAISARSPPLLLGAPSALQSAAGSLRAALRESSAAVLPPKPAGLLPGLVVGDTSQLDPVLAEEFRVTGLSHLLAVSGANCAIVAGAVLWPLRRLGAPGWVQAAGCGLALVGFVILARPSPSVLRAAVMGGIALLALAMGRSRASLPALSGAVLILVLVAPSLATSPGLLLSVAATAGILVFAPGWTARLRTRLPPVVAQAVAVSAAAGLATAPLLILLSPQLSLVSLPANLLAAPAVPIATVLGVLCAIVGPWWPAGGDALAWLAGWSVRWLVTVAEHGAALPDATVPWPPGIGGAGLLVVVIVGCWWLGRRVMRHPWLRAIAAAAVVGAVLLGVPLRSAVTGWPPPDWLFVACDVGQGDALVVNAGADRAIVIDAGPEPVAVDRCLRSLGVEAIPLLVLSHLHVDHAGGVGGVLRDRPVAEIEVGGLREPQPAWEELTAAADAAGVPIVEAVRHEVREVSGVRIEVLGPVRLMRGTRSDPNNDSVVLRVSARGRSVLLTGDIELEAQHALLRSGADLRADVLKVPHHGSAYQDAAFLDAVEAKVAVVSVGAGNDYGHPSPLTVAELRHLGCRVVRTDLDGDVAITVSEEGRVSVATRARDGPA